MSDNGRPMFMIRAISRWNSYVDHSPLRKLGHNALAVALTSLVGKGLSFIKEVLVAASFGVSGQLDVFLVAFVLIGFPVSILLNAVQTALITSLAGGGRSSIEQGRVYTGTASLTLACLAVLLPFWMLLLPYALPWLAAGFSDDKREALQLALVWFIPYYFFTGLNLLGYGVLQAKGRYVTNGLLPSVTALVTILFLFLWDAPGDWRALVVALVVGSGLECIYLQAVLRRSGNLGSFRFADIALLRPIVAASLALLPGTLMLSIGSVVEQAIAASIGEGTNAALSYGFKLPTALQGILITAVGVTVLPYFASQLRENRSAYCLHSLEKLSRWLFAGGLLLVVPLAFFSSEIASLLYQRGAFDSAATERVAPIQFAYFLQLPFALIAMLGMKVLAALGRSRLISIYSIVAVSFQAALAYGLGKYYGATGIAWAASSASALLAVASYLSARKTLQRLST